MTLFTKFHSIRSTKLPFSSHKKKSTTKTTTTTTTTSQPNTMDSYSNRTIQQQQQHQHSSNYSRNSLSVTNLSSSSSQQQSLYNTKSQTKAPRPRTISTPSTSFTETLREISKQAKQGQFDDVFDSFFFSDKRCQDRAIFMAARLKQSIGNLLFSSTNRSLVHTMMEEDEYDFWKLVTDRFYTLNYILFVLPNDDVQIQHKKNQYLHTLEQHIRQQHQQQHLLNKRAGMETYFSFYYALQQHSFITSSPTITATEIKNNNDYSQLIERARLILEHCLDSESKLGHTERDAMYIFHGMRIGFHNHVEPQIVLDNDMDGQLYQLIQQTVKENKYLTRKPYSNPFEDDACIVHDDDDDDSDNNDIINNHHHQVNNNNNDNNNNIDFIDYPITSSRSREIDSGFYEGVIKS